MLTNGPSNVGIKLPANVSSNPPPSITNNPKRRDKIVITVNKRIIPPILQDIHNYIILKPTSKYLIKHINQWLIVKLFHLTEKKWLRI